MILRRMADAIREQSWFTVVLEILIVVIGIFLGLQVDDWNQARKDRASEHGYLERIYDELTADIIDIEVSIVVAERRRDMGRLLIAAIDDPALASADPPAFFLAIERASYTRSPNISDFSFEELKFDGNLGIIRDIDLRATLKTYYGLIETYDQWAYVREHSQNSYSTRKLGILTPEQSSNLLPLNPDAEFSKEEALAALQRMRSKPDYVEQIFQGTNHSYAIETYMAWRDAAKTLREKIGTAIGIVPARVVGSDSNSSTFSWLAGCWMTPGGSDQEVWVVEDEQALAGFSVSVADSKTNFYEVMSIKQSADGSWKFTAHPSGQASASFEAVEIDENRVVFANPDHDYPQEIRYSREGQQLNASISLIGGSEPRSFDKIACK